MSSVDNISSLHAYRYSEHLSPINTKPYRVRCRPTNPLHLIHQPSSTDQHTCRRGSLISRTNLDGLRQFIAVPTVAVEVPLQMDAGLQPHTSGSSPNGQEADGLGTDKPGDNLGDIYRSENDDTNKKATATPDCELRVQECQPSRLHENTCGENLAVNQRLSADESTADTEGSTNKTPTEQIMPKSDERKQEKRVDVHQPAANKSMLGGWRANMSHGLIGRLGAAFHGNSTAKGVSQQSLQNHSKSLTKSKPSERKISTGQSGADESSQPDKAEDGVQQKQTIPSDLNQKHHKNKHKHETSGKVKSEDAKHCQTPSLSQEENHSCHSSVNLPKTALIAEQRVNQTPAEKSGVSGNKHAPKAIPSLGGQIQRGPQFGNVSRAIKEFESTVVDTESNVYTENYPASLGSFTAQPIHLPRRIWDSHKPAKGYSGNYRPRERNREQVGRLQVFFEAATGHRDGPLKSARPQKMATGKNCSEKSFQPSTNQLDKPSDRHLSLAHR